jgi:transcriptional regulator with XRE-family HTH domain
MSAQSVVAALRQNARLTQAELARRAGTSQPAIARLEAGAASPSLATLDRLARAADCELDIRVVPRSVPDPVIAAYQRDIDRTLLRQNLRLTVDQRIRSLADLLEFHAEVARGVRAVKRQKPSR